MAFTFTWDEPHTPTISSRTPISNYYYSTYFGAYSKLSLCRSFMAGSTISQISYSNGYVRELLIGFLPSLPRGLSSLTSFLSSFPHSFSQSVPTTVLEEECFASSIRARDSWLIEAYWQKQHSRDELFSPGLAKEATSALYIQAKRMTTSRPALSTWKSCAYIVFISSSAYTFL